MQILFMDLLMGGKFLKIYSPENQIQPHRIKTQTKV
jgi:hypothetical protein